MLCDNTKGESHVLLPVANKAHRGHHHRDIDLPYRLSEDARVACSKILDTTIKNFKPFAEVVFDKFSKPVVRIRAVPRKVSTEEILSRLEPRSRPARNACSHSFPYVSKVANFRESVEGLTGRSPTEIEDCSNDHLNGNSLNRMVKIRFEGHARLDHAARILNAQRPEAQHLKCGASEYMILHLKIKTCIYRRFSGQLKKWAQEHKKSHRLARLKIHIDNEDLEKKPHVQITMKSCPRAALIVAKHGLEQVLFDQLVPHLELRAPSPTQTHCLRFPQTLQYVAAFQNGGLERAKKEVGEQAVIRSLKGGIPSITVIGNTATLRQVQRCIFPDKDFGKKSVCSIRWEEFDDVVKTEKCGHVACQGCFTAYCASDNVINFPLRCFETKCESLLSTEELRQVLEGSDFTKLADESIQHYLRQNPEAFIKCPGLDCNLYFPACKEQIHDCPGCLTQSCSTCKVEFHYGETCQEFKERTSDHLDELTEWMKKAGAKNCPRCNGLVEKRKGCNHMLCYHCRQHFCFTCLAMFDDGDKVYKHMRAEHGSWFDNAQQEREAHRRLLRGHGALDGLEDELNDQARAPLPPLLRLADFVGRLPPLPPWEDIDRRMEDADRVLEDANRRMQDVDRRIQNMDRAIDGLNLPDDDLDEALAVEFLRGGI